MLATLGRSVIYRYVCTDRNMHMMIVQLRVHVGTSQRSRPWLSYSPHVTITGRSHLHIMTSQCLRFQRSQRTGARHSARAVTVCCRCTTTARGALCVATSTMLSAALHAHSLAFCEYGDSLCNFATAENSIHCILVYSGGSKLVYASRNELRR